MRRFSNFLLLAMLPVAVPAQDLPDRIGRVLTGLEVSPGDVSILVESLDSGDELLSHEVDTPRNPASVMKLVTTWSALEILGPTYTWPTEIYFLDDFDGNTLHGDLAIKGYGDPFLVLEEMWQMLRGLRRIGLDEIQGDVLLDSSHFASDSEEPGSFDGQPYRTYNVPPSALMANFKAVRFQFFADRLSGNVRITSDPELPNLDIRNRLRLVDGPCRAFQAGVSFNVLDPESINGISFEGDFASRCSGYGLTRTVLQHDTYFFGLFQSLWRESGGRVRGDLVRGTVPEDARLVLTWQSPPLAEVIRSINKNSNNVMTRQLLLTLAAEHKGPPGSSEVGASVVREFLTERGIHDGSLVIDNGAGLSRDARISARMLVDLLRAAATSPYAPEFMASLSLGGMDGTTRNRFSGAQPVMHVKTGRLDHVSALAGYTQARDGRRYVFVVFVNAPEAHRGPGQEIEQAVLGWLGDQL